MAKPDPTDKLLDELIAGKTREEVLGNDGILKQLTKRLVEHALEGEMRITWAASRTSSWARRIARRSPPTSAPC